MWSRTRDEQDNREQNPKRETCPRVLVMSPDSGYRDQWRRLSGELDWYLECHPSLDAAIDVQRVRSFHIVVCDCAVDSDEWRVALSEFCIGADIPCVVLTSSLIDDGFRDEVIRHRGYDVLRRNADDDEVIRAVNSAWLWKNHNV